MFKLLFWCCVTCIPGFCFSQYLSAQTEEDRSYRLPSAIMKNVETMESTQFPQYSEYIDIREDIRRYIRLELERLPSDRSVFQGIEQAWLGLLHHRLEQYPQTISCLESFLSGLNADLSTEPIVDQSRAALAQSYLRSNRFEKAIPIIALMDEMNDLYRSALYQETAFHLAMNDNPDLAQEYAFKSIDQLPVDLAFFSFDQAFTTALQIAGKSAFLLDLFQTFRSRLLESDSDQTLTTLGLVNSRLAQIRCIGNRAEPLVIEPEIWLNPPKNQQKDLLRLGKSTVFLYWPSATLKSESASKLLTWIENRLKSAEFDVTICFPPTPPLTIESTCWLEGFQPTSPTFVDRKERLGTAFSLSQPPHMLLFDPGGILRLTFPAATANQTLLNQIIERWGPDQ